MARVRLRYGCCNAGVMKQPVWAAGFLTAGGAEAASLAGGAGLLDALAALRWAARHAPAFGGDSARVTLAARGDRAAHANALLMLPEAQGLCPALFCRTVCQLE